jgi:hypothetical protein
VTERAAWRAGRGLLDETAGKHLFDAGVDALVKLVARPGEDKDFGLRGGAAFVELRLQVTQPLAGKLEDFQAADDAALVVGVQLRRQ